MARKVIISLRVRLPKPRGKKRSRDSTVDVTVEALTLGRFRTLITHAAKKMSMVAMKSDKPIGWDDWVRALVPGDYDVLYECACPEAPPRQFHPSPANTQTLLNAIADTNDIPRLLSCINLNADRPRRNGSLDGDLIGICRMFPGLTPPEVKGWYMDDFLDVCDGVRVIAQAQSGIDLDAAACHPSAAAKMQGVQVTVH